MRRSASNPILTRADIKPVESSLVDVSAVFNPGAVKLDSTVVLLLRVQNRGRETLFVTARSRDGVHFEVADSEFVIDGVEAAAGEVFHMYDPRITVLDGRILILAALDRPDGCCLGLVETEDFSRGRFLGVVSGNDVRNGVLFPERIGNAYLRLDRPNTQLLAGGVKTGSEIHLSESHDLIHWRDRGAVMSGRPHFWDELIGAGTPPLRTEAGWLFLYHGVATHFASTNIYPVGAALLDLEDPRIVIGRTRYNILEPREPYELVGQVPNVVFPSGWVVEPLDSAACAKSDSNVFVYYGAADTAIGLATTTVGRLIEQCRDGSTDG